MSFHLLWFTPCHRDIFLVIVLAHFSEYFLLGILLGLYCFLAVRSACEAPIQSLHFLFFISKKKKKKKHFLIFHYGIFSFDYFALILTHVERLPSIEIVEISLENFHLEAYHLFEIQD
jgi:hypothetical protein